MTLTPGTRLGPYEIAAQIGVGGMGEVYRATDTKLKRDVSVMVLPAALAATFGRPANKVQQFIVYSLDHESTQKRCDTAGLGADPWT